VSNGQLSNVEDGAWDKVRHNFARIKRDLGPTSIPTFGDIALTGLTTDSLIYAASGGVLTSLGAASNGQLPIGSTGATPVLAALTGTANQVTVTNGAGSITLSTPQDIHTGASNFTVAGETITDLTASRLMASDGSKVLSSVSDLTSWIAGTTPVSVADDGDGTVTLDINANGINDTHIDWGSGAGQVNAADVPIALGIGSPTVDQVQEYFDNTGSSGYFTGGVLSDGGSGTLDVSAGEGFIRTTNDDNAPLVSFKFAGTTGLAIADNTTQYVFVNDSGTINLSTDEFIEAADNIMLGVVTDEGGVISHTFNLGVRLEESIGQMGRYIRHVDDVVRNRRKGGLIFGQSGDANRYVTITAGQLEWGRTSYPIPAFDTSGADTFDTYSAGGVEATGVSAWPNTQYDNAGTLTVMTNNRWAVLWWYIEPDGHIVLLYGRAQYVTEGQAEDEEQPASSIPNRLSSASVIASKFIFKKSENIAEKVETAFGTPFTGSGVTAHNNLAALAWTSAGHTGTVSTLAGFDGAGAASEYTESNYLLVDGSRALAGAWNMGSQILTNVNIDTGDINTAVTNTEWDAAFTHVSNDGSDHSFIDQSVLIVASPTFVGMTLSGDLSLGFGDLVSEQNPDTVNAIRLKGTASDVDVVLGASGYFGIWNAADTVQNDNIFSVNSLGNTVIAGDLTVNGSIIGHVIGTDVLAEQTIGIADNNLLEVDDADAADNDFAKFTAAGLEGRSFAETLSDLSGQASAAFDWNGQDLTNGGVLFLTEQAEAEAVIAGKGQFWINTATPNEAYFTDDADTDIRLGNHFVDRGDPSVHDYRETDLTQDGTFYDLDLSSIVPAGAVAVLLRLIVQDGIVDAELELRKNGNTNAINVGRITTIVANIPAVLDAVVACDSNRVVEYKTKNTPFDIIAITVKGWWTYGT